VEGRDRDPRQQLTMGRQQRYRLQEKVYRSQVGRFSLAYLIKETVPQDLR
jgi:hypothetical protein